GDFAQACESDNVADTVSYAEIYDAVKAEMSQPSKLIEHVACRILRKLKAQFPPIEQIEVQVAKIHPPLSGQMDYASVTISE
ncbi:MAG: dihydroneopterin aldolase, partial [Dysgonamonadaceae bacterium]|nr:dihydroneopterin aldolase [Dysgonamonadaceae bacterium]